MIYKEVTQSDFTAEFHRCGRGEQFSHAALLALYEWLDDSDDGEGVELDVIALCCEFAESSYDEIRSDYRNKFDAEDSDEDVLKELQDCTTVVWEGEGRVLYVQF